MTKTLTEQWREGTLPAGHYYCKLYYNGFKPRIQECVKSAYSPKSCIPMSCGCDGEEVLAPVPSYDEYCNLAFQANKPKNPLSDVMMCYDTEREKKVVEPLQKKLEIATNALKLYAELNIVGEEAREALKEMEGVK